MDMVPFIEQLQRLCKEHSTRSKWVFVPGHAVGHTLGDRLALDGTDWANLRFVTPLDIALRMGAPFLVEKGIDPSEEGLGPSLVMRLLLGLPKESGYFRPLADQPRLALAIWATLVELRMAGIRAADLTADRFESSAKHAELQALLAAYERFLADEKRGDRATVFLEAFDHLDWCPVQQSDCWILHPDVIWSPLERRLFELVPGEHITPRAFALPGMEVPRRQSDTAVERVEPGPSAPLAFLMSPENVGGAEGGAGFSRPDAGRLSLFVAGGAEAEVEEVFRRILASGEPLDQVEIVCASEGLATLVWEKALRYEWPVTLARGLPATLTRPGRALIGFAEWVEDDLAAGRLRRLLQSGDVTMGSGLGQGRDHTRPDPLIGITPARAARELVKAKAAWGRETYRLSLRSLARSYRDRAADRDDYSDEEREALEQRARQVEALAGWIQGIIDALPRPDEKDRVDVQDLVACAVAFVTDAAARHVALDRLAAAALVTSIEELKSLRDFRAPIAHALRFLRERVEGLRVAADRPRPGHLHVSTFSRAAVSHRRRVFVVGLEEGRVFPSAFEDPILLDSERARISPSLRLSGDRIDEAVHRAISCLAALSAQPDVELCLSYSCRDLREFRETYASWLMLQAYRVMSGRPAATYRDLKEHLGQPKSCVPARPDEALGAGRWWLHGAAMSGDAGRKAVLREFPSLEAGLAAAEARSSEAFTEYDGHVPEAGLVLDPAGAARIVSATQLEQAAECPFRHFVRRGLGVDAIESGERDREVWIDHLRRGSLLHDLFAQLLRKCRDEGRRAVMADVAWLKDRCRAALDDLKKEMPPPSREIEERETDDLVEDLELFVEAEANPAVSNPAVGLEVAFGRGAGHATEPLAHSEPVTIDLGGGLVFRLAGSIDRIDQLGDAEFEVLDYKTGSFWADKWKGTFAGGRRLQHALYGLAALELLRRKHGKATVRSAQYYFPSERGTRERKRIPIQPRAKVREVLANLREVVASGLFIHANDREDCRWCEFGYACGRRAREAADAKLGDPKLEPFVRLREHV